MPIDILFSDLVYYTSIFACIYLGSYYRKIDDVDTKKQYGTGLGMLVTYLICGPQIYHSVLIIWGNIVIIKCCDRSYIHQLSLCYTWTYLTYLNFNIQNLTSPYQLWIYQTIALRLVGLAFEIYFVEEGKNEATRQPLTSLKQNVGDPQNVPYEPTVVDIIAYAYYFIGLHKGPYYRWKVFQDHFTAPFESSGNFSVFTQLNLTKALTCSTIYIILRSHFSTEIYYEDGFYNKYGADDRYLYNIPHLIMYVLQQQILMMLCTSVCTESGFGAYPAQCKSMPGYGPLLHTDILKTMKSDEALKLEYNFDTLKSFNEDKIILGPRMRDTIQGWDMTTHYWFWTNTFREILTSQKEIRSALSFIVWSLWCGPTVQQIIISSTIWVHTHLEAEYSDLYDTKTLKVPWNIGFSLMRVFCLVYITPCLILQDSATVFKYYNSIYWSYHWILLSLICAAVVVEKMKDRNFLTW